MNCRHAETRAGSYLDGELPARESRLFEEHLKTCPACAGEVDELGKLGTMIAGAAVPPTPEGLARAILVRVRSQPSQSAGWEWLDTWRAWPGTMRLAAAATAVAAVFAGLLASGAPVRATDAGELSWLQARQPVVAAYQGYPR